MQLLLFAFVDLSPQFKESYKEAETTEMSDQSKFKQ